MERARLAGVVAMAFFAGAIISAVAFSDGSPLSEIAAGAPVPLIVEIENLGTHDANATIEVNRALGGGVASWKFELPAGRLQRVERREVPAEEMFVRASVQWSAAADAGSGSHTKLADPRDCARGERLVVSFRADTGRGVSFPATDVRCT